MSRFVRPDTTTIRLSDGDWIRVKAGLSAGEQRAYFARRYIIDDAGVVKNNPFQHGIALIAAYLVEWSFTDDDGARVELRGVSADELTTIVDTLDPESYAEVLDAIEAHRAAEQVAREEKKRIRAGGTPSPSISDSRSVAAGVLSGSAT